MQTQSHPHPHDSSPDHEHAHDAENLQRWLKAALLLGLGAYFTYNILSGNLANYINARFAWLSYVAAVLFLVLGAVSLVDLRRADAHHHAHDHGDSHDHAPSWPMLIVVAVPLLLGTLIPSRPLGADAIAGNLSPGVVASSENAAAFTTDPLEWNLLDWLRAFNRSDDLNAFNDQQVDLIGFVYRAGQFPENHFMVARFAISCCVADAAAIGLPVAWDQLAALWTDGAVTQDTWVRVQGRFQVGNFGGNLTPILQAEQVEIIEEPEHPYLYP